MKMEALNVFIRMDYTFSFPIIFIEGMPRDVFI